MFGYVTASWKELTKQQRSRYGSVYCGICRRIRIQSGQVARLGLSYDMAFLALLLMSLYEPEEQCGKNRCLVHPGKRRPWVDNPYIGYCADMNVALAYYNCLDDWQDDQKRSARLMAECLEKKLPDIETKWPRQCRAIRESLEKLSELEKENCPNPDGPAGVFGELMGELLVLEEDLWAPTLYQLGNALGRFVYLVDAALDYDKDTKQGKYNPWAAMGTGKNPRQWEEYLVLTMGRCTAEFEKLPLVQDKDLLDNILYSGVWSQYKAKGKKVDRDDPGSV